MRRCCPRIGVRAVARLVGDRERTSENRAHADVAGSTLTRQPPAHRRRGGGLPALAASRFIGVTYVPGLYRTSPPANHPATPYSHDLRVLIRTPYAAGPGPPSRT